jgi:HAMP domain-containing protein
MALGSAQVETTLVFLKIAFLVLLYLFIWRIVRSAARDLRLPQK